MSSDNSDNRRSSSSGSDFELAYASPIILSLQGSDIESTSRYERKRRERTFSDEEGKLEEDGRNRRSQGSSDDDEGSVVSWDGFSNEDLRAGGPNLCPLPVKITALSRDHPFYSRLVSPEADLKARILSLLEANGVSRATVRDIEILQQVYRFRPQDGATTTISISATRTQRDAVWVDAARSIKAYLSSRGLVGLAVEIADPLAFVPNKTFAVESTHRLFGLWDKVRDRITATIDLTDVQVLGCYRFGKGLTATDNAPTVVIIVHPDSRRLWKMTREIIIDIIRRFHLGGVAVAIFKDQIVRSALSPEDTRFRELLAGPAVIGRSLGPRNLKDFSGTLGGFVQLLNPKSGQWHTFGLTCFHCVVPGSDDLSRFSPKDQQLIRSWYHDGIKMNDPEARRILGVDHPTHQDMGSQIDSLDARIVEIESQDSFKECLNMEKEGLGEMMPRATRRNFVSDKNDVSDYKGFRKDLKQFRDAKGHHLGLTVSGSGFRERKSVSMDSVLNQDKKTCLDWALVRVSNERLSDNSLENGRELRQADSGAIKNLIGKSLNLHGRSSGVSKGTYGGLLDALILNKTVNGEKIEVVTVEHSVVGVAGEPFSLPGDSGALVHTPDHQVVGLHFAGSLSNNFSYFTHIHDLFADIEAVTGAGRVRLYNP